MADTFKRAGALFQHGTRMAGRLEVRDPRLLAIVASWEGRSTEPYLYEDAVQIGKGNLFMSFELRTKRNPKHLDGFVVTRNLLGVQIAWGNTEASKELNNALWSILGPGRCEVEVDLDYFAGGRGVIAVRRPDAVAVQLGQQLGSTRFAAIAENTRQYRTPTEARCT